jgi:hypothetical protein
MGRDGARARPARGRRRRPKLDLPKAAADDLGSASPAALDAPRVAGSGLGEGEGGPTTGKEAAWSTLSTVGTPLLCSVPAPREDEAPLPPPCSPWRTRPLHGAPGSPPRLGSSAPAAQISRAGRTARYSPVRQGRRWRGARRRRAGTRAPRWIHRGPAPGEVEEREREGAGRAAVGMQHPQGCACRGHRCILQQKPLQYRPRLQNADATGCGIGWRGPYCCMLHSTQDAFKAARSAFSTIRC